jgi:hypothetical protein
LFDESAKYELLNLRLHRAGSFDSICLLYDANSLRSKAVGWSFVSLLLANPWQDETVSLNSLSLC